MEIDIGVWRIILAISGDGRLVVRRFWTLGVVGRGSCGSAGGSQFKYLRGERFVQLGGKDGRITQGAFVGCR